jgi:hypothetical protein
MTHITAISVTAQQSPVQDSNVENNPLLTESSLPFHVPPFDKIKDDHFVPAMEEGMREQLKEVELVANNSEKPTFDIGIHPCAAALGRPCVVIGEKQRERFAIAIVNFKHAHIGLIVFKREISAVQRNERAARFRRVPVAGERDVGDLAGRDRRTNSAGFTR